MRRFILTGFLVGIVLATLLPGLALAQEPLIPIPEFNPLCWKKNDCVDSRRAFNPNASDEDLKDGWVPDLKNCPGEEWGKCLPGGQTVTSISFGGQRKFADLGVFILQMYRYAIGLAGVVAVIVLIVSGIQWAVSGGSSEVISGAKTRIGGALIGLFIAYMSYVILNTINPNLVNFRLPSVWMLKPQAIMPKFCSQMSDKIKNLQSFAFARGTEAQSLPIENPPSDIRYSATFFNERPEDKNERNFYCGKRFYVKDLGKQTCWGDYCDRKGNKNSSCLFDARSNEYSCQEGNIFITVTHNSLAKELFPDFLTREWNDPPVNSIGDLYGICTQTTSFSVSMTNSSIASLGLKPSNVDEKLQNFVVSVDNDILDKAVKDCEVKGGTFRGLVVSFFMNESFHIGRGQRHFIGRLGEDLGDDFFFAQHWKDIPNSYFLKVEDVRDGVLMQIEAAKISDISQFFGSSTQKDQDVYFKKFGISHD